jgi:hypothetical protein
MALRAEAQPHHDLGVGHGQGQCDGMLAGRVAGLAEQLHNARADEPALPLIVEALNSRTEAEGIAAVGHRHPTRPERHAVAAVGHLLAALDGLGQGERSGHP